MKALKKLVFTLLILLTVGSLCACGIGAAKNDTTNPPQKPEADQVKEAVEFYGAFMYSGASIGGNELTSSSVTVTNLKKITETQYNVSGKIVMTDVYGTNWNNTFDCEVTKDEDNTWNPAPFEYTSKNWTKG